MLSAHTISRDAPSLGNEPRDLSGIKTGLILLVLGISSKPSMSTARSTQRQPDWWDPCGSGIADPSVLH